jgi:hypothetical protein
MVILYLGRRRRRVTRLVCRCRAMFPTLFTGTVRATYTMTLVSPSRTLILTKVFVFSRSLTRLPILRATAQPIRALQWSSRDFEQKLSCWVTCSSSLRSRYQQLLVLPTRVVVKNDHYINLNSKLDMEVVPDPKSKSLQVPAERSAPSNLTPALLVTMNSPDMG